MPTPGTSARGTPGRKRSRRTRMSRSTSARWPPQPQAPPVTLTPRRSSTSPWRRAASTRRSAVSCSGTPPRPTVGYNCVFSEKLSVDVLRLDPIANGRFDQTVKNAIRQSGGGTTTTSTTSRTTTTTSHTTTTTSHTTTTTSRTTTTTYATSTPTGSPGSCSGVAAWSSTVAVSQPSGVPFPE